MIKVRCLNCDAHLGMEDQLAGHKVRCPRCHVTLTVPPPGEARPDAPVAQAHTATQAQARAAAPVQAASSAAAAQAPGRPPSVHVIEGEEEFAAPPHPRHHLPRHRKRSNTAGVLGMIVVLSLAGFAIGFFMGSAYEYNTLTTSGRLMPAKTHTQATANQPTRTARSQTARAIPAAEPVDADASTTEAAAPVPTAVPAAAPQVTQYAPTNPRRLGIVSVSFSDQQNSDGKQRLQFWFSNGTEHAIARIVGRIEVYDNFNEHLGDLEINDRSGVPKGGNNAISGDYHLEGRLAAAFADNVKNLHFKFETDQVVFDDGSSESFTQ